MTEQRRVVEIIDAGLALPEYQRKQLAAILIASTVTKMARDEIVKEFDMLERHEGCGEEGPGGYRCTHHENGEHVARGTEPGSFAESWSLVKPSIGEWRYSANEANYFRLLKDAKRGYVLEWCEYQPTPDTPDINIGEVEASAFDTFQAFSDFCVVMGGLFNVGPAEIMRAIK